MEMPNLSEEEKRGMMRDAELFDWSARSSNTVYEVRYRSPN